MFTFLLVVHAIIAAALVTVILMQRSEGGGLGMGSGPSGLMTARGAADFLTRATAVLATLFVLMAFLLATLASMRNGGGQIDTSLAGQTAPGVINAPAAPAAPIAGIPMMGTPAPAAPDGLTPPAPAASSAKPVAQPTRHVAASSLKTIDTHAPVASVGINGVSSRPLTTVSPPAPASAPLANKAVVPTISIPAPPASAGNEAQAH